MSRWSPSRLHLALRPDGAAALVLAGFPRRAAHRACWRSEPGESGQRAWEPALDALRANLVPRYYGVGGVRVTLSNHFCRYALFPRPAALSAGDELVAYAQHRMRGAFGDAAGRWELRLTPRADALLVCALDSALPASVEKVLAANELRTVSIQPSFAATFNHFRSVVGRRNGWFVVQEPGCVVMARFEDGRWAALASRRTRDDTAATLVATLEREWVMRPREGEPPRRVWLASTSDPHARDAFGGTGYDVTMLAPPIADPMNVQDPDHAMAA